jgi:hypothetical protein
VIVIAERHRAGHEVCWVNAADEKGGGQEGWVWGGRSGHDEPHSSLSWHERLNVGFHGQGGRCASFEETILHGYCLNTSISISHGATTGSNAHVGHHTKDHLLRSAVMTLTPLWTIRSDCSTNKIGWSVGVTRKSRGIYACFNTWRNGEHDHKPPYSTYSHHPHPKTKTSHTKIPRLRPSRCHRLFVLPDVILARSPLRSATTHPASAQIRIASHPVQWSLDAVEPDAPRLHLRGIAQELVADAHPGTWTIRSRTP